MKSRNKKRLLALVLCMVVAISNSSFIFASETGQAEYPQEAEVQTQDEAVADDMDVAAYAADEGQAVAEEQPAAVEQVAAEPAAEPETTAAAPAEQPAAEAPAAEQPTTEAPAAETPAAQEPAAVPTEETALAAENATAETPEEDATQAEAENQQLTWSQDVGDTTVNVTAEAGALPGRRTAFRNRDHFRRRSKGNRKSSRRKSDRRTVFHQEYLLLRYQIPGKRI